MVDRKELAKKSKKFDGKKNVWVTDKKEGFIKGEIIGTKGEEVTVLLEDSGQVSITLVQGILIREFVFIR